MLKVVKISWFDPAFSRAGWMNLGEAKDFISRPSSRCDTVGHLVHEDDERIVLAMSVGEDQLGDMISILKANIKSMETLAEIDIDIAF